MNMLNYTLAQLPKLLPPEASTFAEETDSTFMFITWVCVVFFVLIVGLMTYFVIAHRRKSEDEVTPNISHNLFLEIVWSIVPIILVLFMFYWGYTSFAKMMDPMAVLGEKGDAKHIDLYVKGKQWAWDITYPNGEVVNSRSSLEIKNGTASWSPLTEIKAKDLYKVYEDFKADKNLEVATKSLEALKAKYPQQAQNFVKFIGKLKADSNPENIFNLWAKVSTISSYMTVPVRVPVRLSMTSNDVIHSFAVPAFRIKKDVILNRNAVIWFNATKPGMYIYTCNEMCGLDHGHMIGYLRVVEQDEYALFEKSLTGEKDPWETGKKIYSSGCIACHSLDGTKLAGPTWKGLYGSDITLTDGTVIKADHDYIRESITNPLAKKRQGFEAGVMPPQGLTDQQLQYLLEFIKSPNQKPETE
jgi:cytochrome c oxidase subunit II